MKNKHLEHLEDDILNNGSEGGKTSIAFLRSLGSMLSQGDKKKDMKVTTNGMEHQQLYVAYVLRQDLFS